MIAETEMFALYLKFELALLGWNGGERRMAIAISGDGDGDRRIAQLALSS